MKRVLAGICFLAIAACSENPTQPVVTSHPQFATVVGSGATWHFTGVVDYIYAGDVNVGDVVQGTIKFTILNDDAFPDDPCIAVRPTNSEFSFTVNGVTKTMSGWGTAMSALDCYYNINGPRFQVAMSQGAYYALDFYDPAITEDTPLTPPAVLPAPEGQWYSMVMIGDAENNYYVKLTRVWMDPATKADCKNDGYKKFNFRNQGLCVSYVETGKDSR